ncbi:MAG: DegT/DnrJ/EryC1/StrS family aminotransferase [Alphaproteobacteria bacterium]|nr:DegT/DnrJ/EryC1/StrS family aminotransferase [Alphaproteobacteria bacterium]
MINVTKAFLPPKEEFMKHVSEIFDSGILTNHGKKVQELEQKLAIYFGTLYFHYVTNGTVALQLAIECLDLPKEGEIITTPFSYVATTSSILWEKYTPVYADIKADDFTLDPEKIEELITDKTVAIMPVHVFGYNCEIENIQKIADKHNLKVIYDAAHTFGAKYKDKQLATYGDISTLSFHATKLFHTIEGGGIICKNEEFNNKIELMKRFGHTNDNHQILGINAKQDEFNAAMGLTNLNYISQIIEARKKISFLYDEMLSNLVDNRKILRPLKNKDLEYNYAYYPIVFENENILIKALNKLKELDIFPRRYFYPSLNTLPYLKTTQNCPISESISKRIICLPLYVDLEEENIEKICKAIKE